MSIYNEKLILYVCMDIHKIFKYSIFKNKTHTTHTHMIMLGILGTKVARGCP